MWVTLFDERVLVDLETGLGWEAEQIARRLSSTLLAALGASADSRIRDTVEP